MMPASSDRSGLVRSLRPRHVTMIALGGIIGAGLFVGSGAAIATTGPAVILSYLLAGLLILSVIRMLGEMAVRHPGQGAFTEYARLGLGRWAGFTTGWLYWYFWVVVVGIEAIAGAKLLQQWIDLSLWQIGTVLMLAMTAVNLLSARSYGEFEFWFASIKVAAIVAFILVVGVYILRVDVANGHTLANLTSQGGPVPFGPLSIVSGVASVIFALTGAEIVTVAAAESGEPERAIAQMTRTLLWRILIFYVVSILLIVCVLPWDGVAVGHSPFTQALERVGIPGAATIMNLVVLTAVLSCLNSGIYVSSRILYGLSLKQDAPAGLVVLNERGVPIWSILLACAGGYLAVLASILSPERIFSFLVNASGVTVLIIYLLICLAYVRQREKAAGMSAYVTIVAMCAVLVSMAFSPELATQLYLSLLSFALVVGAYAVTTLRRTGRLSSSVT